MSKAEILHELPKLGLQERREIFERIGELEDQNLLKVCEPTAAEKALLDANWRTAGKILKPAQRGRKLNPASANQLIRELAEANNFSECGCPSRSSHDCQHGVEFLARPRPPGVLRPGRPRSAPAGKVSQAACPDSV